MRTPSTRRLVTVGLCLLLGGCSWFADEPTATPEQAGAAVRELVDALGLRSQEGGEIEVRRQQVQTDPAYYIAIGLLDAASTSKATSSVTATLTERGWDVRGSELAGVPLEEHIRAVRDGVVVDVWVGQEGSAGEGQPTAQIYQPVEGRTWALMRAAAIGEAPGFADVDT